MDIKDIIRFTPFSEMQIIGDEENDTGEID